MLYKEDWDKVKERFEAYWQNEIIDRCCVSVKAPKNKYYAGMDRFEKPFCHEEIIKWYRDVEFVLERHKAAFENTYFGGDALPVLSPSWGGSGYAMYLGCNYRYTKDSLWFPPTLAESGEYRCLRFDPQEKHFIAHKEFLRQVTEYAKGKFLVEPPDYIGNLDAVICLRGAEDALRDMCDEPENVMSGMKVVMETVKTCGTEFFELLCRCNNGGSVVEWFNTWAKGTHCLVQCDFSVMLSPRMFEEFVLPDLNEICNWLDYAAYHIDGDEQLRFLDMLLSVKGIKAFQWTNVAGQPSVLEYIPVFRKIQNAGKQLIVYCTQHEIEKLLSELSPKGLMVNVAGVESEDVARDIVKKVEKWTVRTGNRKN